MNPSEIPIPQRMINLPRYKGLPVPVTFAVHDGVPDFAEINMVALMNCIQQYRCGLCGDRLGRHLYFIGGPMSCTHYHFGDTAMHEECARYAMKVCPFLAMGKTYSKKPLREGTKEIPHVLTTVPEKFGLLHCTNYTLVPNGDSFAIKAVNVIGVEWFKPKSG